jgi:hypothetical protein
MPPSVLRDYYLWGLDPDRPYHEAFLRAIGVSQLANLTVMLLDGLVEDDDWPALLPHAAAMNVYQVYEVISDNLGIGMLDLLDEPAPHPDPAAQRDLLLGFNAAMVRRLHGSPYPAAALLADLADSAAQFSALDHSLASGTHHRLAAAFAGEDAAFASEDAAFAGEGVALASEDAAFASDSSDSEAVFGLWPALVSNIESCAALVDRLDGSPIGEEVRDGLALRYGAVSRALCGRHLPLVELAAIGAQAILVVPTLGYYVGVLTELGKPVPALVDVVQDGTLPEVLYDAAVLVRLLNDLGPALLQADPRPRRALLRALHAGYETAPDRYLGLGPLLLDAAPDKLGARLRKDLRQREFNICLYGLRHATSVPEALVTFADSVDYFARLYIRHHNRLGRALDRLTVRLGDARVSTLVERFVRFHEKLYARPYTDASGDYAN